MLRDPGLDAAADAYAQAIARGGHTPGAIDSADTRTAQFMIRAVTKKISNKLSNALSFARLATKMEIDAMMGGGRQESGMLEVRTRQFEERHINTLEAEIYDSNITGERMYFPISSPEAVSEEKYKRRNVKVNTNVVFTSGYAELTFMSQIPKYAKAGDKVMMHVGNNHVITTNRDGVVSMHKGGRVGVLLYPKGEGLGVHYEKYYPPLSG